MFLLFYCSVSWSKLIEINNGLPIHLMLYLFILFLEYKHKKENIATTLTTRPRLRLKCSAEDLSVHLLYMQDTQIYPFSHQSDTFALSDCVLRYQILQNTQIILLPKDQSDPGS